MKTTNHKIINYPQSLSQPISEQSGVPWSWRGQCVEILWLENMLEGQSSSPDPGPPKYQSLCPGWLCEGRGRAQQNKTPTFLSWSRLEGWECSIDFPAITHLWVWPHQPTHSSNYREDCQHQPDHRPHISGGSANPGPAAVVFSVW